MTSKRAKIAAAVVAIAAVPFGLWLTGQGAEAADHGDPPDRLMASPDAASDIADFYAWHTMDGKTVFVLTFDGVKAPADGQMGTYDRDVLYQIHVDNTADAMADMTFNVRFGQDGDGNSGIQVEGLPGADATLSGAAGAPVNGSDGTMVYAGLHDDPFFFDLEGFLATVETGDLQFCSVDAMCTGGGDGTRDSIAGTNATAIVIEVNTDDLLAAGSTSFQSWANTARITP